MAFFKYTINYYDCDFGSVSCSDYVCGNSYSDTLIYLSKTYDAPIDNITLEKVSEDNCYEIAHSIDEEEDIEVPVEYREGASAEDIYWSDMCEMWQDGVNI